MIGGNQNISCIHQWYQTVWLNFKSHVRSEGNTCDFRCHFTWTISPCAPPAAVKFIWHKYGSDFGLCISSSYVLPASPYSVRLHTKWECWKIIKSILPNVFEALNVSHSMIYLTAALCWLVTEIQTIECAITIFRQWYAWAIRAWPFRKLAYCFRVGNAYIIIDTFGRCGCRHLVWIWIGSRICCTYQCWY